MRQLPGRAGTINSQADYEPQQAHLSQELQKSRRHADARWLIATDPVPHCQPEVTSTLVTPGKRHSLNVNANADARAVLITLYSDKYPAIGESHGLSVVAGGLQAALPPSTLEMRVLDMVQWGEEDCTKVIELIHDIRANILAVGLPYGTFTSFEREYPAMLAALYGQDPLIVLGGPIATYLSETLLTDVAPEAIIIQGEAEHILPTIVERWLSRQPISDIRGIHYLDKSTGTAVRVPRRLADLASSPAPFRGHILDIYSQGGQIFTETSRGCSWAACTFCLRGLTDIAGKGHEYRRRLPGVVATDLGRLHAMGITDVTFADEDFLGAFIPETQSFVDALQQSITSSPRLDASLTIHSVYSRRDSSDDRARREAILKKLAQIGLQKAFLGIESCSPSQLKRYAKGHTREEAVAAARLLQKLDIRVEIGVILFDPLCTLDEIEDSLAFMRANGLASLASGLSSSLRLQIASHYLSILNKYEVQHGRKLYGRKLDADTLSYPYKFVEPSVQTFYDSVELWNRRVHSIYYPAKSLSRFGATGALGGAVHTLREATERFREASCDAMLSALAAMKRGREADPVLEDLFGAAATSLATAVLTSLGKTPPSALADHPVFRQAVTAAQRFVPQSMAR